MKDNVANNRSQRTAAPPLLRNVRHKMMKTQAILISAFILSGCAKHEDAPASHVKQTGTNEVVAASPYTFQIVRLFDLGRRDVRNFAFAPITRQLFVSHLDKKDDLLYQWDIDSGRLVHTYHLGGNFICDNIAVSPDGRHLLVGCWPFDGYDCKTLLIDTREKRTVHDFGIKDRIFESCFSTDGRLVWMRTSQAREEGIAFRLDGSPVSDFTSDYFSRPGPTNIWTVPATKNPNVESGLFYRDSKGDEHLISKNHWHDNYGLTTDGRLLAATDWDDHVSVWNTESIELVFRAQTTHHQNGGGYLVYDPKCNRFLIGDCSYNGTTWLRALTIKPKEGRTDVEPSPAGDSQPAQRGSRSPEE